MKSKLVNPRALTILTFIIILMGSTYFIFNRGPLGGVLEKEWIEARVADNADSEGSSQQILPYGYTLGPWPIQFQNEPIVSKLTYIKGPPKKFLQSITQQWKPVEAELTIHGPRTLIREMNQNDWKQCFESRLGCALARQKILEYLGEKKDVGVKLAKATWFDHLTPTGPRGVHLLWDYPAYQIDQYIVLTENGIAQGFELKSVKSETGDEARKLLVQALGSLSVREDLSSSKEWIQNKIKSVNLDQIRKIPDTQLRMKKLIEIQGWLFSLLTVDPSQVTPFFHLAGVTHLLTLDLIKASTVYENQESWILSAKPTLDAVLAYSRDFERESGKSSPIPKQIESLIQDVLLQQQKASRK